MPSRRHLILLLVAALSLWALSAIPTLAGDGDMEALKKAPVRVDFNDVIESDGAAAWWQRPPTLKIAVAAMISPKFTYRYYIELLNLIGDRMERKVLFVQKKTYAEVNEMLQQNALDLAFVCSGPYVSGKDTFGLELLVVPVCHGQRVYHSYYIASVSKGIQSFGELRGKTFAFTDPLSNTGYMVPVYDLAKQGETPESYFKSTFFTHSHDNSIQAVAEGLADGAAVDSLIFEFIRTTHPELTAKTKIIDKSPPYGMPPVVACPAMTPDMKDQLKKIFLSIHEDPDGKGILKSLQIDRFVEGNDDDYQAVRELQEFLKSIKH